MSTHTAHFVAEWNPTGLAWEDITPYVEAVEGNFESAGRGNGAGFGDSSDARSTLRVAPRLASPTLDLSTWSRVPVRVQFTRDAFTARGVAGLIIDMNGDTARTSFEIAGWQWLIRRVRAYSPLFERRPIATKTTALSIEDPTNPSYAAGPLNWIMWQAGGRPLEQAATYTSAPFYYSLDQGLIAPRYSWSAGEDAWDEALKLVRAAGGQLYQRPDGVIKFVSPLSIAGGSPQFAFTPSTYGKWPTRRGTAGEVVSSYNCTYIPRSVRMVDTIVEDREIRVVKAGAVIEVILEPQYPIASLETTASGLLHPEAISATFYDGTPVPQGAGGYTHEVYTAAQRIQIFIQSAASQPFVVERITLRGAPIVPGEPGVVTVGSGDPVLTIEPNPDIQSEADARRLCRMAIDFYGVERPVITLPEVAYNPELQLGIAGTVTIPEWDLDTAPCVIVNMRHDANGKRSQVDVVVTTGLPTLNDYFVISAASQAGQTKRIGY